LHAYLLEFGEEIKRDVDRHESSANPKDRLLCCLGGVFSDVLRGILRRDGKRTEADISNLVAMFHVHRSEQALRRFGKKTCLS
jgi:hypothetical protein